MQTYILLLGIVLTGQVANSELGRYGESILPPGQGADQSATEEPQRNQSAQNPETRAQAPAQENPLRTTVPPKMEQPVRTPPRSGLTKVTTAAELLRNLTRTVGDSRLDGEPTTLADSVGDATSRVEQAQRVRLYWELSEAVTNFQLAALEELELQSLRNGISQAGLSWTTAQQAAAARKQLAETAVKLSQVRLQSALGRSGDTKLPLPLDLPHCGAYESKYEQIFRGRGTQEAKQLSELLPLRHSELVQRADAAVLARNYLVAVSQQRSLQDDGTQLLKAYENLAMQRRSFVSAAYKYNANIARYTELAVPQEIGSVRLVSMLIQTKKPVDESVQQASAVDAAPPAKDRVDPQRTFSGGQQGELRRKPPKTQQGERSILVSPQ